MSGHLVTLDPRYLGPLTALAIATEGPAAPTMCKRATPVDAVAAKPMGRGIAPTTNHPGVRLAGYFVADA
jgi:hypothetical protein